MELLAAIEALPPARALRASFYAYPVVNAAHILSIGALVTGIILMDLRVLGLLTSLERGAAIRLMRRLAGTAFAGAVATGMALFAVRASDYASNPAFLLKMALIALAGANLLALRALASGPDGLPARNAAARGFALVSIVLWLAVLLCGRFIGFL